MLDSSGLAYNGGPTQTIALQKNSPALGAGGTALAMYDGTAVSADQTGVSRVDPEEIGAFYLPGASIDQNTANLENTSPTLTITGSNFDPTAAHDSVTFSSGAVGTVTSASSDSITVTFSTEPAVGELDAVVSEWGVTSGTPVEVANVVAFPTLDPASVSSVNYTQALASGNVTSAGTDAITARGFLYAPTSAGADLSLGSAGVTEVDDATASTGAFDDELTGLSSLTQYSLVAFATSDAGTSYSPITTFTTTSIVVNTLRDSSGDDDQTSLRQAIAIADADGGNQTITFDPSLTANGPATITLDGTGLSLDDTSGTLTIQGPGADLLSIDANNDSEVFNLSTGSSATLNGLTITGGNGSYGGGIEADSRTTLNVNDCVVTDNSADAGGGIWFDGSAVTINDTTFSGDSSQYDGAGLTAGCTDVTVEGCTFSGNTASNEGAAVWAQCTNVLISDSCIEQNVGHYYGGVFLEVTTITIDNSTIADNTATAEGAVAGAGLLDESGQGNVDIINSTIAGNTSPGGFTPGLDVGGGSVTLDNTILADASDITLSNESSNNLFGPDAITGLSATSGTNLVARSIAAMGLGTLGNYGGATQTIPLLPGSPAIDAGSNTLAVDASGDPLTTDQRGSDRIVNGTVDIGAYESKGFTIAVSGGNNQTADVGSAFATPLAVQVTANDSDLADLAGGMITLSAPSSGAGAELGSNTITLDSTGDASVDATANQTAGNYDVTATGSGISTPADFTLTNQYVAPTVAAASVSSVNYAQALASGNVTSAGTDAITARGFLYAPTSADADLTLGSPGVTEVDDATASTGAFDDELTGLSSDTQYSVVAFATNAVGTSYSSITTFTSSIVVNTLSDSSGDDDQTSLRQAIAIADANGGNQTIAFDPSLTANGPATITLDGSNLSLDDTSGTLTIQGPGADLLSIDANNASQVFSVPSGSSATLNGLTITGGNGLYGGGIDADSGTTLNVNDCVVTDNSAHFGGGIYFGGSAVTITNTTLSGNTGDAGAGLGATCTDVTVEGCTVSGNTASNEVAALYVSCTNVLISDSCIEQNVGYSGGEIFLEGTTITIDNSTIADNTTTDEGSSAGAGTFYVDWHGYVDIINSTIAGNTSPDGVAPGLVVDSPVTLDNTILADPSSLTLTDDSSNNLFGPDAIPGLSATSGTNLVAPSIAAMGLGTLGNYGGATQTIPLLPGSPAIDAGSNTLAVDASGDPLTADQRGSNRIVNGTVDIGAYESQGFTIAVSGGNNQTADVDSAFATPLAVQVTANDSDLTDLAGGMITLSAPSSGASAQLGSDTIALDSDGDASVDATANETAGTYDVTAAASGISTPADFTLSNQYVAPTVTLEPASQTVDAMQTATFTAAASGDPAPTVQWQVSSDGGTNYTDIPNATSTTLQVIASRLLNGNLYRAVFTNGGGSATSDAAMLNVNGLGTSIVLSNLGGAYTGLPRPVTVQVSGVDAPAADSLEGVSPSVTYYQGQNQTGAASPTPPINPGDYSVFIQFPGSEDYAPSSAAVNFSISKASPVLNVASASVVYDGHSHAASGSAQGVESVPANLTSLLQFSYRNATTGAASSKKAPTLPGTYEILATFAGNADYVAYSKLNTGKTLTITPFAQVTTRSIVTQGTTAALSGRIAFAGAKPSGSVQISIDGVTRSAKIARNGDFAIAFPVGTLRTGTYSIEYAFNSPSDGVRMTDGGTLQVGYDVVPTYNVKHSYPANSHITLSFELDSAAGKRITSGRVVRASGIASAATPKDPHALPSGSSANGAFTADDQTGTYSMNLSTAGLAPGRYVIDVAIQGDPTSHSLAVVIA
jgi:hypothetical protein